MAAELFAGSTFIVGRTGVILNSQDNQGLNLSYAVTAYTSTTYNVVVTAKSYARQYYGRVII